MCIHRKKRNRLEPACTHDQVNRVTNLRLCTHVGTLGYEKEVLRGTVLTLFEVPIGSLSKLTYTFSMLNAVFPHVVTVQCMKAKVGKSGKYESKEPREGSQYLHTVQSI